MKFVMFSELVLGDLDKAQSNLDHLLCITGREKGKKKKRGEVKEHQDYLG